MKNNKILFATLFFIVTFSMIWISCEKTDELRPTYTSEELMIPDEATDYISTAEIDEMYTNVREEAEYNYGWILQPVTIKLRTNVTYTDKTAAPEIMTFKGVGVWKEMKDKGDIKYFERVYLNTLASEPWTGKGTITLMERPNDPNKTLLPAYDYLTFLSGNRNVIKANEEAEDAYRRPPNTVVRSKIAFTGGTGDFNGAYGEAYKMETYYTDKPGYCETFIYGFIKMKGTYPAAIHVYDK